MFLERADGLFAGLVDKLSLGVLGFSLVGGVSADPLVHLFAQGLRHGLMLDDQILEGRGQMNLARPRVDELVEGGVGQGAGAVLNGPAEAVFAAGFLPDVAKCFEVDGHLGQGAVGQDDPAVACPGLDADLADPGERAQPGVVPFHERVQVLGGTVLQADLADLSADRDGHSLRLEAADETGEIGADFRVQPLLLIERRPAQVDKSRTVDVYVVEAGRHCLVDEIADGLGFSRWVGGVLFGRCLEMVALDKEGTAEALPDGGGQYGRSVFGRALAGVADLGAGDLEDEGAGVESAGGPEDGPGRVVSQHAQVHGGDSEDLGDLAAAPGHVEVMDGGGPYTQGLSGLLDQPAGGGLGFGVAEDGLPDEGVHLHGEGPLVLDGYAGVLDFEDSLE